MTWQAWLAPSFVGIVLGLVASYFTARQTRRHAEKMFKLQRATQRQDELEAQSRSLAQVALTQLTVLSESLPYTVYGRHDPERDERCRFALEELRQATLVIPDRALRELLGQVQDILNRPDDIAQWGKPGFDPRQVVFVGASEGIKGTSSFIRGDGVPAVSEPFQKLRASFEVTMEELAWQWEEQDRMREGRDLARNKNDADSEASGD